MVSFSQDFIDTKLAAIRACANRPAQLPVDKHKEREQKKQQLEKEKKAKSHKQKAKQQNLNERLEKDVAFKPPGRQERVFKTRELNLDKLIKVRVNDKTEVYVEPGKDIEALKEKYNAKKAFIKEDFGNREPFLPIAIGI